MSKRGTTAKCEDIWKDVRNELYRAARKHRPMASAHEGYAVIKEELDELWQEIKHGTVRARAEYEAIQVAAMAIRLIGDIYRNTEKG